MDNIEEIKDKCLFLILSNYDILKEVVNNSLSLDLFINKDEDKFLLGKLIDWNKKYKSKPSIIKILEDINNENHDKYLIIKTRVSSLSKIKAEANEFNYFIEQLKHKWAIENVEEKIKQILITDKKVTKLEDYASSIKKLSSELFNIHNQVTYVSSGQESFTTKNIDENINTIRQRDTSTIKRFHLGHDPLDEATGGFMPGEVVLIVGNVNQGKSMVLANSAYYMWYHDNANILILTAEMQPEMFDDRIYSRASAVDYSHILNGKTSLTEDDQKALDAAVREIKSKDNQIIVKWLNNSDNVSSVEKYIEDLYKIHGFIPDVLIIDSLECLTPLKKGEGKDWQDLGQVVIEFKSFAETFMNGRKLLVISTHQAKTTTQEKEFKDIDITDLGRSKIIAEKSDAAIYIRCREDLKRMNVKAIKARRFSKDLNWSMSYDFSRVLITNIENDSVVD